MPRSSSPKRLHTRKTVARTREKLYDAFVRSKAQLRATLYSIGDAVIATDAKGRVMMMNPVAERLTGWREDEARGKPLAAVFRIVNEETRAPVENPVTRVLREGTVIGLANHTVLIARDGREIPIADAGAPIFDARHKIVGVVLVFRDQTAERAAQRAVQEAREYAESIIATARDPLIVLDANLRVVSANRAFYRVFATTPAETEGRLLYELGNRQWDIPELRRLLEEILPHNTSFDDYHVTHDFECVGTRTLLLNARRIHREEGKTELILLAIEDLTARQIAEDARRASEDRFRRLADNAQDLIYRYEFAPTRGFTYVSPSATTITGYTPEDHYADPDLGLKLVHPDDRPLLQQYFEGGGTFHDPIVLRWKRKDGRIVWTEQRNVPIFDAHGNLVAIEGIARDITARKRRERELEAQARIAQALGETQELQPLLERLIAAAVHAIPDAEKGSIALLTEAERLQVCALYGYRDASVLGFTFPITWGYAGRAARERRPLLIADVQADADLQADAARVSNAEIQALCSAIAVPLLISEKVIGVVSLESVQPNAFDEHDLRVLTNIATTTALAIERRRWFEETQNRLRELEILQGLSAKLRQARTVEEMIPLFVQHAIQAVHAQVGTIFLLEESSGDWIARGWVNAQGEWVATVGTSRHRHTEGITGKVGTSGEIHTTRDWRTDPLGCPLPEEKALLVTLQSAITLPLRSEARTIGVMHIWFAQTHDFSDAEKRLLMAIADMAGNSLQRARWFEETKRRAEKIAAVNALGRALSTTLDLPTLCRIAYQHIRTLVACDNLSITLYDTNARTLRPAFVISESQELEVTQFPPLTIDANTPRAGRAQAILDAQTVVINDLADKARQGGGMLGGSETEPQSAAYTPMLVEGKVIGLLELQSYRNHAYQPDDLDLLQMLANQIGLAIQNARLFQEAYDRLHELETLYRAGLELGTLLEPRAIGAKIIEILKQRMNWQHAVVRVRRGESDELETIGYGAPALSPEQIPAEIERMNRLISRVGQGLTGWVIQNGVSVRCDDVSNDPRYVETYTGIRSGVYAPIRIGERVLGAIGVESDQPNAFDESAERFLRTLATQAASALANAHLFAETCARLNELNALHQASQALLTSLDPEATYAAIHQAIARVMPCEALSIVLEDEVQRDYHGVYLYDKGGRYPAQRIPRGTGLSGHVIPSGKTLVIDDYAAQTEIRAAHFGTFEHVRSILAVPLRRGDKTIGMVATQAYPPHAFTPEHRVMLETLAAQFATRIENARLYERTERQVRRLSALRAIDRVISSSFDLRVTLNVILEHTITQLGVDAVSVLVHHPHTHSLEHAASRGFRTRAIEQTRLRVGESLAGHVALEREIVHLPNLAARANGFIVKELVAEGYSEYYGVPLIAKGNVVGVMEIFNRAPLPREPEWHAFCETLAGQAAIAIDNARLFNELQQSNTDLMLAYDATIKGWSRALELRDKETEGHTERVTEMTLCLARAFGMAEEEIIHLRRGALLHDIGKLSIPDAILLKPAKLTDEEMALMREHPRRAYEMLLPIEYLRPALAIPHCHHEKWDGTGYPRGLQGEEIPLAARLFAVADVYDALISDRPYRKAWSRAEARAYIRERAGKCFDPRVVEVFLQMTKDE